jgi:hypothetical protein
MQKEIVHNSDWEILTPSGWSDFIGVSKTTKNVMFTITFDDGTTLQCSEWHLLKYPNGEFLDACHVLSGDILFGGKVVTSVTYELGEFELYDAMEVELDNEYFTNDVISHNCAFIDNIDIVWSAAQQTLATGGKAILLSSPNGTGNFFHKTWEDAENNPKSRFHHIRLPWTVHPERDQAWREKQDELLGPRMASQECDADFISSGNTLLEPDLLSWYENTTVQEPVEKRGFDGNLWIWEYPNYSRQYVVSADVARGDGGDYSAFHIIDVETLTQVAEYKGQIGTKEFGHMLMSVATEYNKALLVVENANVGWAALQPIIESGYENLFYAANDLSIMDIQAQIAKGYDLKDKYNMKPGFSTTSRTRPLLISKLDTVARERCIIIRSKRLMSELRVFIWKGDRAEAQSGYNDDLVMSFCIGLWVRDTAFKLIQQGLDLTKRALGHIHKSGETSIYSPGIVRQTGWSMSNGKGSEESLTWLI